MHQTMVNTGNSLRGCQSVWIRAVRVKAEEEVQYGCETESGAQSTC
jgi:hypothetical protein